ncbi:hypothetical protein ASG69_09845 [Rhodococcus sp. Leaf225]|nr:hypothetical protein ASG69_09845 [Rhodococcus sp. Leaf225]KQU46427.1 hypothetical protein ASH03_06880 [Rhodococcus sp. Leaf258]
MVMHMKSSDVVVSHAGVGSAMQIMDIGMSPVLVAREQIHNEHVDNHQLQIARELALLGLATHRQPEKLVWSDLVEASKKTISLSLSAGAS